MNSDSSFVDVGYTPTINELEVAEAIKLSLTKVELSLATEMCEMETEKGAVSYGIDIVFERGDAFNSILVNARAVITNFADC